MAQTNQYAGVTEVVHLSSDILGNCDVCYENIRDEVGSKINHYVQKHGYRILHVGVETHYAADEKTLYNSTIAILGR